MFRIFKYLCKFIYILIERVNWYAKSFFRKLSLSDLKIVILNRIEKSIMKYSNSIMQESLKHIIFGQIFRNKITNSLH